jgi:hypothetical protein
MTAVLIGQMVATQMACGSLLGCDPPAVEAIRSYGEFVMWVFVGGLPQMVVSIGGAILAARWLLGVCLVGQDSQGHANG